MRPTLLLLLSLLTVVSLSQPLTPKQIDRLTEQTMKEFNVPGIAVAVISGDAVVHMKGYGVRSISTGEATDENTLFAIASNTKAFTAATLAILVDQGKISWDTKVIDVIPEFRLYDYYVTADFTIRDLLTHRSGMGLGAGDLMSWPDSADFTTGEIIHNLRFLRQTSSFRTRYDYDNMLYIVAGEVVARVAGMSWEEFTESYVMAPLGMSRSAASFQRIREKSNIIDAHVPVEGQLQVVPKQEAKRHNSVGGIYSSVSDMTRWVLLQLNGGRYGTTPERQIFSEKSHQEMWTMQTIIPVTSPGPYRTHFAGYGLGWHLTDVSGQLQVYHTGSHAGIVTRVTMLPEISVGIIVLTNQQEPAAHQAITNTIIDGYLGLQGDNWIASLKEKVLYEEAEARKITSRIWATVEEGNREAGSTGAASEITGTYSDPWFGDVVITEEEGRLRFRAVRSPKLRGEMYWYKADTFIVRWDDRTMDADAFALFQLDREGKPSAMTMDAISPLTDFSFDFHDLRFKRKSEIETTR